MAHVINYRPARFGAFGRTLAALSTLAGFRTAVGIPTSTTDNTVPRFDGTAGALKTSGVTIDNSNNLAANSFQSRQITLADDAATSFVTPSVSGTIVALVASFNIFTGLAFARTVATTASAVIVGGANFRVGTGVHSGTTGTDAFVTVAPHSDSNIYVENRTGGSITMGITVLKV
jgi:hypothetical protein